MPIHVAVIQQILKIALQSFLLRPTSLFRLLSGSSLPLLLLTLQIRGLFFQLADRIRPKQIFKRRGLISLGSSRRLGISSLGHSRFTSISDFLLSSWFMP